MSPRVTARIFLPLLLLATAVGCEEKPTNDSGWWEREAPDITGQYQFFVDGVSASNDCTDQTPYVTDWMPGALGVSGDDPLSLSFTFSDGMVFTGGVDSSWSFWFNGTQTYDVASVAVTGAGVIFNDDTQRGISATIQAEVDDDEFTTNNCIIEVRISGSQLSR